MAGLKEIRTRISSVRSTRQVTSAMKMVSAAKLKRAQDAILQIRPYANKLHQIMLSVGASLKDAEDSVFTQEREPQKVLIVLISSNKGLCGGFNMNIAKKAVELIHSTYSLQYHLNEVDFLCVGKQAEKHILQQGMNVTENFHELFDTLDAEHVYQLAEHIMKMFAEKKYDRVELVYNEFLNAAVQHNCIERFLPLHMDESTKSSQYFDYIYEPSKEFIVKELIPLSLKIQFYKSLLDSNAAEHGARMTAMHQATDNATELIKELTTKYNKFRQSSITNEILEIVSGAEALNS